jgi:TolA-binding protein
MTRSGRSVVFLIALIAATPLAAQQSQEDRIQRIEQRLDELAKQQETLRQELNELKAAHRAATAAAAARGAAPQQTAAAQPQPTATQEEDLTKIEPVAAATQTAASAQNPTNAQPQSALTDVQTIVNQVNPGAAKALNPDISAIGNFVGKGGTANPYEFGPTDAMRSPLKLDEAELAFQAYVDPYAKANFFLSASPEGLSIEEAYAQFVTLPYDLTARAGKFKAMFGKANTWHTHLRPWVDQPLVIHNFFTDDQLSDDGVEISKVFPNEFAFVEGTAEVFAGNNTVFHRHKQSDLFYDAHLRIFKDITENSNVEIGGSFARGTLPDSSLRPGASSQFGGVDVTFRWKPLIRSVYNSMIARFEGMVNDRADIDHRLTGYYASLDYQLAQRWFTGVRLDRADRANPLDDTLTMTPTSRFTDRGVSATLTFWPSEFSQLRGQLRHTSYGGLKSINELLFQLQFSIGAHGAHTF